MHVKEWKIKKTWGKEGSIYKVCSIEPRDKMPTYSLVQWESQNFVVLPKNVLVGCVDFIRKIVHLDISNTLN